VGPQNLPARVAFHASQMYARNLQSFLSLLVNEDGALTGEFTDEILAASLLAGTQAKCGTNQRLTSSGE